VNQYFCADARDLQSKSVPKAFIFIRHDGEFSAFRHVFSESKIVFCAMHPAGNICRTFGFGPPTISAFWNLTHPKILEREFFENSKAQAQKYEKDSRQSHTLEFLEAKLQHFSP
jgi:hypothetical protein